MAIIDYLIIILYLVIVIILGIILEKKASRNIDSYFLGDRKMPWWLLGVSGMVSNTDLAGTMLIAALVYSLGTKGFFIEIRGGLVLIMPFLMTFMGKWNRRAQVMTLAEWMEFRFGKGKEGKIARIISAVAMLIFSIASLSYFSVAGGKFLGQFLGMEDRYASICLAILALIYTVISGFYGVIWTDFFQAILIFVAIIYICTIAWQIVDLPETFSVYLPGSEQLHTWSLQEWTSIVPPLTTDLSGDYATFNLLGGVIGFYLFKTIIEGCSGQGGYMVQRYFASSSDREAGLLSLFWIILLSFRWPLVTAFAILGINYSNHIEMIKDPELILPIVINNYIPMGMKGLIIACFMAAAMSSFDSLINASAAYWVKDIYQAYLQPQASNQQLLKQSRLASVLIVVLGLVLSFNLSNINGIWSWLTVGLGVGLAVPLLMRWYWWRFNGYGLAIGTASGAIAAIMTKVLIITNIIPIQSQEYLLFLIPGISSLLGCILGTLLTPPPDLQVIENFYIQTRPFGFWDKIRLKLNPGVIAKIKRENRRDILATVIAIPWQLVLFMMGIMFMSKNWENFGYLSLVFIILSISLYFLWYRHLNKLVIKDEGID